jgi:uracil-DNA glycosylase
MKPQLALFKDTYTIEQITQWVGPEWTGYLQSEFNSFYMNNLFNKIKEDKKNNQVYPQNDDVFRLYKMLSPNDVKLVILSQSPYPGDYGDGIAFSTRYGTPRSLKRIKDNFKTHHNDLSYLVKQGVWLQNCILTCNHDTLGHKNWGWERFVQQSLKVISERNKHMVWWAWGSDAKKLIKPIVSVHHKVFNRPHPVNKGVVNWDIQDDIIATNKYLITHGKKEIDFAGID